MNNAGGQTSWRGLPAYLEDRDAGLVARYVTLRKMLLSGAQGPRTGELVRLDEKHSEYCGRLMDQILTRIELSAVTSLMDAHDAFLTEFEHTASTPQTDHEITAERKAVAEAAEAFRSSQQRDASVREAARSEWLRTHKYG
jgi:hypothetical protein